MRLLLFNVLYILFLHAYLLPRPLILILDGGHERLQKTAAFNEPLEYVVQTRTIPCIVSGPILEQYQRTYSDGLKKILSNFSCYQRAEENLYVLVPCTFKKTFTPTKKHSSYELAAGLNCEHAELCKKISFVETWYAELKRHSGGTWVDCDIKKITSLFITEKEYEHQEVSPYVIYCAGHGIYKRDEAHSALAGMHYTLGKKLIDELMHHHSCALMVLDTCHGGGRQAQRLGRYLSECEKQYGVEKSFPLVVIGVSHDIVYSSTFPSVKRALDGLFRGVHAEPKKSTFKKNKNIERSLHGFIEDALGATSCWSEQVIPASRAFFKVTKTPQVRMPGNKHWDILPLGARHIVLVKGSKVTIDDKAVAVLIKQGATDVELDMVTKNTIVFMSERSDHEVCAIKRINAQQNEFTDFLRYGFFDLVEPHAQFIFKIHELVALEKGKKTVFTDVVIVKKHNSKLEGEFGCVSFKKNNKRYKATIGWFKHGPHDLKIPAHAVKNLEITIKEKKKILFKRGVRGACPS